MVIGHVTPWPGSTPADGPSVCPQLKKELAAVSERQELDRTSLLELQADLLTMTLDRETARHGDNTVAT